MGWNSRDEDYKYADCKRNRDISIDLNIKLVMTKTLENSREINIISTFHNCKGPTP